MYRTWFRIFVFVCRREAAGGAWSGRGGTLLFRDRRKGGARVASHAVATGGFSKQGRQSAVAGRQSRSAKVQRLGGLEVEAGWRDSRGVTAHFGRSEWVTLGLKAGGL